METKIEKEQVKPPSSEPNPSSMPSYINPFSNPFEVNSQLWTSSSTNPPQSSILTSNTLINNNVSNAQSIDRNTHKNNNNDNNKFSASQPIVGSLNDSFNSDDLTNPAVNSSGSVFFTTPSMSLNSSSAAAPRTPLRGLGDFQHHDLLLSPLSQSNAMMNNTSGTISQDNGSVADFNFRRASYIGEFNNTIHALQVHQQQQQQQQQYKTSNSNVWNDTRMSIGSAGSPILGISGLNLSNNSTTNSDWSSPPLADFAPLRRYSYDSATAAAIAAISGKASGPHFDNFINGMPPNAANADFMKSFDNSFGPSRNSDQLVNQFNNLNMNNTAATNINNHNNNSNNNNNGQHHNHNLSNRNGNGNVTDNGNMLNYQDQLVEAYNEVSNYFGLPSPEILDLSKYLEDLNTPNLPLLTPSGNTTIPSNFKLILCCFKNARLDVFYVGMENYQLMSALKIGDLVIVEADRGRDLGKVVKLDVSLLEARLLKFKQNIDRKAAMSKGEDQHKKPILTFPKNVIRFAHPSELTVIGSKKIDEIKSVDVCQIKVRQHGLNMTVVDSEYQWDRKKLTFYYLSESRIDFRELVKELFRVYKIRIWMSKQGGMG